MKDEQFGRIFYKSDLSGKVFESLTVINLASSDGNNRYWNCKCFCGNVTIVASNELKRTKSCGCLSSTKFIDYSGKKYNNITIDSFLKSDKGTRLWNCTCDCGNKLVSSMAPLKNNSKISCGCIKRKINRGLKEGDASFNIVYNAYRARALKKGLEFHLNKRCFKILTSMNCLYCSSKPSSTSGHRAVNGAYVYNGLDRLDNDKGYTLCNVVTCCKICNYAKNTMSVLQFYKRLDCLVYNKNTHINSIILEHDLPELYINQIKNLRARLEEESETENTSNRRGL